MRPVAWPRRRLFWIVLATGLYAPWIDVEPGQGNVASDLAAIESLVERRTFFINDSTFFDTHDKFRRRDRYFSQKSPLFHLAGALPYALLRAAGLTLAQNTAACLRVLTLLLVIWPMGWLLAQVHDHPWMRDRGPRFRLGLTLGLAGGSLLTPMAVTLNHYVPAAAFLLRGVTALMDGPGAGEWRWGRRGFRAGFWGSASLACDVPPAFLFGLGVGLYFLWRARRELAALAMGAAPLLTLYAGLNWAILGSPLPPNLHEEEMLFHEGSYWAEVKAREARGEVPFYAVSYGRRLFHASFGYRGIYWMMPTLALGSWTAGVLLARRGKRGLPIAGLALFPPATIALMAVWARDLGGGCYVIRHVLATVPPLYCALGHPAIDWSRRALRTLLWTTTLGGGLIAAIGVGNPWSHNTLSGFPPAENVARWALRSQGRWPTDWIAGLIRRTATDPPNAWLDYGLELLAAEKLRPAARALAEAIAADADYALAYYYLGIVQDMTERPAEAARTYERLLDLEPGNVGAWNNLGLFRLHLGDLEGARLAYDRSLALVEGNASALWGKLIAEELDGRADPASPLLAEALRLHPEDARFREIAARWGRLPPRAR